MSNSSESPVTATIRLILADDQYLFLEGLKTVIEVQATDMAVVATALNGLETIEAVERHQPDIILMDVRMPNFDGVMATRVIRSRFPKTQVIILTTFDDDDYVYSALQYGAAGYLLKDTRPARLFAAIRSVFEGGFLVSPSVVARLSKRNKAETQAEDELQKQRLQAFDALSKRERSVFEAIAAGYDNHEISDQMAIAPQTVKNYVSDIYSKLSLPDRLHLIRFARSIGVQN